MRQPLPPRPTVHETRLRVLRDALADGEHSGESTPFDFDASPASALSTATLTEPSRESGCRPTGRSTRTWGIT
jgi:hypothetical protein